MHVPTRPRAKGKRLLVMLVGLATMLALVATSMSATPGGFGEVYTAKTATLKKTLFDAKLLPANKTARNIALAGLRSADKKVNLNLAYNCWKKNSYKHGNGRQAPTSPTSRGSVKTSTATSRRWSSSSRRSRIPSVGKITYSSAKSNPAQALTDFRAAIAQGVDVMVTYPDFGDAMIPVFKEATAQGHPRGNVCLGLRLSGPGTNYLTVVGEDTCALGAYAS